MFLFVSYIKMRIVVDSQHCVQCTILRIIQSMETKQTKKTKSAWIFIFCFQFLFNASFATFFQWHRWRFSASVRQPVSQIFRDWKISIHSHLAPHYDMVNIHIWPYMYSMPSTESFWICMNDGGLLPAAFNILPFNEKPKCNATLWKMFTTK